MAGPGKRVTICLVETDQWHHQPVCPSQRWDFAPVKLAREQLTANFQSRRSVVALTTLDLGKWRSPQTAHQG
jgi:hypothetical protein